MTDENKARVYGMSDPANREPPAAEGMRGEQATERPRDANPALKRVVALDSGRLVEVREDSGVGWAEAAGRAGLASPDATAPGASATPRAQPPLLPMLLALGGGIVAGTLALGLGARARRRD